MLLYIASFFFFTSENLEFYGANFLCVTTILINYSALTSNCFVSKKGDLAVRWVLIRTKDY